MGDDYVSFGQLSRPRARRITKGSRREIAIAPVLIVSPPRHKLAAMKRGSTPESSPDSTPEMLKHTLKPLSLSKVSYHGENSIADTQGWMMLNSDLENDGSASGGKRARLRPRIVHCEERFRHERARLVRVRDSVMQMLRHLGAGAALTELRMMAKRVSWAPINLSRFTPHPVCSFAASRLALM